MLCLIFSLLLFHELVNSTRLCAEFGCEFYTRCFCHDLQIRLSIDHGNWVSEDEYDIMACYAKLNVGFQIMPTQSLPSETSTHHNLLSGEYDQCIRKYFWTS